MGHNSRMQETSPATIDYPMGDTLPATGQALAVTPGVRWVRMALPFALDHINLWLLRDEIDGQQGWTIIDCGIANQGTQDAWEQVFATQLEGLPVLRVIVTHMHPDHVGNAHWLTERWSTPQQPCRLWMSATDFHAAHLASKHTNNFGGERAADFFASHGLTDPESVAKIRARTNYFSAMVPDMPHAFHRLRDGLAVKIGPHTWSCHVGHGHAPEHMALHCPALGVLISGDMVLPRISTNVSVYDAEPEADSLTLFLQSLDRMRALPADTLVLPSHGKPFSGLHARIDQLHEHHRERLAEVVTECQQQATTAADLLPVLFKRKLDLHQTTFAMGEAVAHLHALWHKGTLTRTLGADGIYRFSC
ncbi:MAG: MBL fold metallo-hydrolase [Aquabacterium sp.]|uniref:MBL fold metallo-hydrolase n=1 Tax=Aquabacterium sp. TaxID=1872578 RepID=UPI00271DE785|nr:MBL fold metallo-hydrolase [Aquabacterium sp.]MDO9003838.1 MBL fold metallo-hydrolase [Aquabacterium sp.]